MYIYCYNKNYVLFYFLKYTLFEIVYSSIHSQKINNRSFEINILESVYVNYCCCTFTNVIFFLSLLLVIREVLWCTEESNIIGLTLLIINSEK